MNMEVGTIAGNKNTKYKIGNAPCSWGTLEFFKDDRPIAFDTMLDELVECGYVGTELGDWGFMPTDPEILRMELQDRGLNMLGAFVPVNLKVRATHELGKMQAVKIAQLIAACRGCGRYPLDQPVIVLSDDNGTDKTRVENAGRVTKDMALSSQEMQVFAEGALMIAAAVRETTGLRTVFHAHCAGWIETPDELERLMNLTHSQRDLLGIVMDFGHYAYGSGRPCTKELTKEALSRFGDRIWYLHLKDCSPDVAHRARAEGWDYFTAVKNGVFCELGKGCCDFEEVFRWIEETGYNGWVLVEQDVLPGMGSPLEFNTRNREYCDMVRSSAIASLPSTSG